MSGITAGQFESLCEKQTRALLAYLYTLGGDYHQAEDLAQEALAIAHQKREHYFPEADFGAWLRAIARNVWMRERRAGARRPAPAEFVEELADRLFTVESYGDEAWSREREALRGCLDELEETDRALVRDHFSGGRRYSQLAEAAGRTVSWVKVRMFRARRALADCVRRSVGGTGSN